MSLSGGETNQLRATPAGVADDYYFTAAKEHGQRETTNGDSYKARSGISDAMYDKNSTTVPVLRNGACSQDISSYLPLVRHVVPQAQNGTQQPPSCHLNDGWLG